MHPEPLPEDLGAALAAAVSLLRAIAGDEAAPLVVLTPSRVNAVLARRELALATPYVRVAFTTPDALQSELAAPLLRAEGLRPEPPLWLRSTLTRLLRGEDLGPYGARVREPGWLPSLSRAIGALEAAGVGADTLAALASREDAPDVAARAALLSTLLRGVGEAREAAKIWSPGDVAAAAARALEAGHAPFAGAILLGDRRLGAHVFRTLRAFLAARPVLRIDRPPLSTLAPAPQGLTRAAPHARSLAVAAPTPLQVFARTPDPVREVAEAVREIQAAIAEGTPLDRVALVLPDVSEAVSLREALERAGIPATWQVGPPLSDTPAARLLLQALNLAGGDDTVTRWYELLRTPGLALRRNLGPGATRGRGRWRRLLARCGAHRGTETILAALTAYEADQATRATDPDADAAAFASLRASMGALADALSWEDGAAPWGVWAGRWARLVRAWWPTSPDQRRLLQLLDEGARHRTGPPLTLAPARDGLGDTLEHTDYLRGSLTDPAIRVLLPMQTLGGEFDLVCVLGLTQGRFPADPSPDPILDDALVEALDRGGPSGLLRSSDRAAIERRRLAAVRTSARRQLWLSCPRVDLDGGRPLLPGTLLLELAGEGGPASMDELEAAMVPRGRRSRPFCQAPERALGRVEHLVARLHDGADEHALAALADHPWGRRLMAMHRALDRLRAGDGSPEVRPYAFVVDADRFPCPGLDATPLDPAELASLVDDPAGFLFRRRLRAWRPVSLRDRWAEDLPRFVRRVLLQTIAESEDVTAPSAATLRRRVREAAERAGADLSQLGPWLDELVVDASERLARDVSVSGPALRFEGLPVDADLPWRLSGAGPRMSGARAEWIVGDRDGFAATATALQAAALRTAGREVTEIRRVPVGGAGPTRATTKAVDKALQALRKVTEEVAAGVYRGKAPSALVLEGDAELPSGGEG